MGVMVLAVDVVVVLMLYRCDWKMVIGWNAGTLEHRTIFDASRAKPHLSKQTSSTSTVY
jgi:hypothetical protein